MNNLLWYKMLPFLFDIFQKKIINNFQKIHIAGLHSIEQCVSYDCVC